jgi:hypothetical protein
VSWYASLYRRPPEALKLLSPACGDHGSPLRLYFGGDGLCLRGEGLYLRGERLCLRGETPAPRCESSRDLPLCS